MSFSSYNDQTSMKNKVLIIKKEDMKTTSSSPNFKLSNKSTPIDSKTKYATIFHAAHASLPFYPLPHIKNQGAYPTAPTVHFPTLSLYSVIQTYSTQPHIKLLKTEGAIDGEPEEPFEFTPSVPSSVSAPPHPVPFIQRFSPEMLPMMLMETWDDVPLHQHPIIIIGKHT
jgi:hypothetical protein